MIPSRVVTEIRSALVEYLANTFALADEAMLDTLSPFLEDEADGIFGGPYLRVRTPFRSVDPGWRSPLDRAPDWFVPRARKARSFERLAGSSAAGARLTLVTTGTIQRALEANGRTVCILPTDLPGLTACASGGYTG